jgi:hypothetical protein
VLQSLTYIKSSWQYDFSSEDSSYFANFLLVVVQIECRHDLAELKNSRENFGGNFAHKRIGGCRQVVNERCQCDLIRVQEYS